MCVSEDLRTAGSAHPGESSRGNHGSQETGIGDSPSGGGGAIAKFEDRGGGAEAGELDLEMEALLAAAEAEWCQ